MIQPTKRLFIGKQIEGPIFLIPRINVWAGILWVFWMKRSLLIKLPQWLIDELLIWGFNPIDD